MKAKPHPLDQMTPVERKYAIEHGQDYDRVPCVPFIGNMPLLLCQAAEHEYLNSPECMATGELLAYQRFGFDRLNIGPNTAGISAAIGSQLPATTARKPLDDYAKLDRLEPLDAQHHPLIQIYRQAADMLMDAAGEIVPIEASIGGPLTIASYLRETEWLLRDCIRRPEEVHRLLRIVTDSQKRVIDVLAACGVGIAMADPVASPSLIGPRFYENLVFPYTQELTEYAYQKTGQKVSLHMCGQTRSIWKYLSQYPLNEVSLDNIVDLDLAAAELGCNVPIAGNVDPVEVMRNGTKEDIFCAVKACIRAGRNASKGFHLTTGCDIPDGTAMEKVDWFMEAARLYGNPREPF